MAEVVKKNLGGRFARPLGISLGIAVVIWLVARGLGFPFLFQMFFVVYVFVGLILVVYLDARDARQPRRPVVAITGFLLVLTVLFVGWGFALPQYNPEYEIKRIERMKKMAQLDVEDERLEAELAALEATKQGWLEELKKDPQMIASLAAEVGVVTNNVAPMPAGADAVKTKTTPAVTVKAKVAPAKTAMPSAEMIEMGKQAMVDYECTNCHFIGGKGGTKKRGPKLDNIGSLLTAEQMKRKLLDPGYLMAEGFEKEFDEGQMPDTFGEQMSKRELKALVAYLMTLTDTSVDTPKPIFLDEE